MAALADELPDGLRLEVAVGHERVGEREGVVERPAIALREVDLARERAVVRGDESAVAERAEVLRYGENPHQQAALYRLPGAESWWDSATQLNGKEMSYLNVLDTEAAWQLVSRFDRPAAVIVKHANACGVALGATVEEAYAKAHAA